MRRRAVLGLGLGALSALPARGDERRQRPFRLGIATYFLRSAPYFVGFEQRLGELGYSEGRNLTIDLLPLGTDPSRYPSDMQELVRRGVDAIVVFGNPSIAAAQQTTRAIPIVGIADDMVGACR